MNHRKLHKNGDYTTSWETDRPCFSSVRRLDNYFPEQVISAWVKWPHREADHLLLYSKGKVKFHPRTGHEGREVE